MGHARMSNNTSRSMYICRRTASSQPASLLKHDRITILHAPRCVTIMLLHKNAVVAFRLGQFPRHPWIPRMGPCASLGNHHPKLKCDRSTLLMMISGPPRFTHDNNRNWRTSDHQPVPALRLRL
jgi:hypothetical protein